MKLKIINYSLIALVAIFSLAACDKRDQFVAAQPAITDNLVTVASKESNLTIFVAAVKRTQFDTDIALLGNYTVFAPTDAAFTAAGITSAVVASMPIDQLRIVLRNHLISGRVLSTDLLPGPNAAYTSVQREILNCSFYNDQFFINAKKISSANFKSLNGVLHKIDGVLIPAVSNLSGSLAANPNLSFLAAAITRAGLTTTLNTTTTLLTIFAPTNTAFQAAGFADIAAINAADPVVLSNILRYHVIPSSSLTSSVLTSPFNRAGRAFSIDFTNATTLITAQGTTVAIGVSGSGVTVKGTSNTIASNVTSADFLYFSGIPATNQSPTVNARPGVLHIIDRVLLP